MKHLGPRKPQRSLATVFAVPLIAAVASIAGLVAALIGNGPWDLVSWVSLGTPVLITGYCLYSRRVTKLK